MIFCPCIYIYIYIYIYCMYFCVCVPIRMDSLYSGRYSYYWISIDSQTDVNRQQNASFRPRHQTFCLLLFISKNLISNIGTSASYYISAKTLRFFSKITLFLGWLQIANLYELYSHRVTFNTTRVNLDEYYILFISALLTFSTQFFFSFHFHW